MLLCRPVTYYPCDQKIKLILAIPPIVLKSKWVDFQSHFQYIDPPCGIESKPLKQFKAEYLNISCQQTSTKGQQKVKDNVHNQHGQNDIMQLFI